MRGGERGREIKRAGERGRAGEGEREREIEREIGKFSVLTSLPESRLNVFEWQRYFLKHVALG